MRRIYLLAKCVFLTAAGSADGQALPLPPAPAGVQTSTEQGIQFSTVNAPGNPAYDGGFYGVNAGFGAVSEPYRIARTEMTVGQWLPFVQAYGPYIGADSNNPAFTSIWIAGDATNGYQAVPGSENMPIQVSFRYAARFANWLNNDRRTDLAAFQSGAYDATTFTQDASGRFYDQTTHTPGARFYIASSDQWLKAMYYDADRNGPGQGGYWLYPNGSNTPLISGWPEDGGETNAGIDPSQGFRFPPIASYPGVMSPWGLLDGSGGYREITEFPVAIQSGLRDLGEVIALGTRSFDPLPEYLDRLDFTRRQASVTIAYGTFRIATNVPGPGVTALFVTLGFFQVPKRKRSR